MHWVAVKPLLCSVLQNLMKRTMSISARQNFDEQWNFQHLKITGVVTSSPTPHYYLRGGQGGSGWSGGGGETDGVSAVSPPVKTVGVSECPVQPPGQAVTCPLRLPVKTAPQSSLIWSEQLAGQPTPADNIEIFILGRSVSINLLRSLQPPPPPPSQEVGASLFFTSWKTNDSSF